MKTSYSNGLEVVILARAVALAGPWPVTLKMFVAEGEIGFHIQLGPAKDHGISSYRAVVEAIIEDIKEESRAIGRARSA